MPQRLSKALGVTHRNLIKQGAFDGFTDVDSRLYVDPHLLGSSKQKELAGATQRFDDYFENVLKLLLASSTRGDLPWVEAKKRLTFPETPYVALGYTKAGVHGRAVGPVLAAKLTNLAKQIVDAGVKDPDLFTLLGLLQEDFGPDLVSDMTIAIILPELAAFAQRVGNALNLDVKQATVNRGEYELPLTKAGQPRLLIPADVLRSLPVAYSWDDVDVVASHNEALRNRVNQKIGDTWRKATGKSVAKKELREAVLQYPDLLKDLLEQYKAKKASGYDFTTDPEGVQVWFDVAQEVVAESPLDLKSLGALTPEKLLQLVQRICVRFKELVEANRLYRVLYNDDGSTRREKVAQLLFFALATFYCEANDLGVSPEADAGVGPVDFKFNRGAATVTVEVKLSSNPNVVDGFESQLPAYNAAERTHHSILLVVRNGDHDERLKELREVEAEAKATQEHVPKIIIVDARKTPSASKRRSPRSR
jgi:hypothetical protein